MLPDFEFASAGRIVFGTGAASRLGTLAAELGSRILLVTGREVRRHESVHAPLGPRCVASVAIAGEPTVAEAIHGARVAIESRADLVVALGGGSVIDAGKAIAALARNPGDPLEHIEVVGRGRPLLHDPLPVIALPTTSGTGAEVTRNAVLGSPEHRVKASLRSPRMLPRVALVDPQLTVSQPRSLTVASGMDALTQLLEPFVCTRANPLADSFCRDGLSRVGRALRRVAMDGNDLEARSEMSLCSLLGGLALANAGLGAVHGFAGPMGGMFDAPHGALCAALVGPVTRANVEALRRSTGSSPLLDRYAEAARRLTGNESADVDTLVAWLESMARELETPGLSSFGIRPEHAADIAAKAAKASSMKANPVVFTEPELKAILAEACR